MSGDYGMCVKCAKYKAATKKSGLCDGCSKGKCPNHPDKVGLKKDSNGNYLCGECSRGYCPNHPDRQGIKKDGNGNYLCGECFKGKCPNHPAKQGMKKDGKGSYLCDECSNGKCLNHPAKQGKKKDANGNYLCGECSRGYCLNHPDKVGQKSDGKGNYLCTECSLGKCLLCVSEGVNPPNNAQGGRFGALCATHANKGAGAVFPSGTSRDSCLLYLVWWPERSVFKVGEERSRASGRIVKWIDHGAVVLATWTLPDYAREEFGPELHNAEQYLVGRGRGFIANHLIRPVDGKKWARVIAPPRKSEMGDGYQECRHLPEGEYRFHPAELISFISLVLEARKIPFIFERAALAAA